MSSPVLKKENFLFLKKLSGNNNREWFNDHKEQYTKVHDNLVCFAECLLDEMNKHDKIETPSGKKGLHRIYRDIRFSKDKTPYHTHWGGGFRRATQQLRGGYYFHLSPGNSFAAGGFWGPNTDDMKRIREDIDLNYEDWQKIFNDKTFVKTFGSLKGEQLSSAPRGYAKDHPAIGLLKYKQFLLIHPFSDEEVMQPDFVSKLNEVYRKMRPFFNYMSEVLTTDANGESVL